MQLGHARHGAVLVHDFHQCAGGVESCHAAEVDGGLGVSASAQHAVVLCVERVDVAGAPEGLRGGIGVGQGLDGLGAVVCRHAGGASLQLVYGDGERSAQHRGVVLHLVCQFELVGAADGDGCAEHASGVFQHEVHLLGCYLLCCNDQVAFVLAVFVIDHDDKLAFSEVVHGFFYAA